MSWRYQPVCFVEGDEIIFSLCEVFFDENETLKNWTKNRHIAPMGGSIEELSGDLSRMLVDAFRWQPVMYTKLEVGMTFERAISPDQAEALAQMVEGWTHNLETATSVERQDDGAPSDDGGG